jgi:serine/threonine protein kinase
MQSHLPRHYVLLSRYYLGRVLGQGGFGVTYLARDLRLDRPVAIKEYLPMEQCTRQIDRITIRSQGGDRQVQYEYGLKRFLEEAKSLAQFENHPCIVSISDFAEANGTAYLVMAYLEGVTLKQYLANQGGRIPYTTAIQIMMPVMDALREVHKHGILHRDISPDNIFLTRQGQVKLLDFGAARYAIGEQSQSLSMILKPGYAPEEQYRTRGKQGSWTDVYAVAATLYRCVTGQVPPSAPDRVAEDELEPPSKIAGEIPPTIEAAILQGMAVRATNRFQTIEAFERALMTSGSAPSSPTPPFADAKDAAPPQSNASSQPPGHPPGSVPSGSSSKSWIGVLIAAAVILGIGLIWLLVKNASHTSDSAISTISDSSSNTSASSNSTSQASASIVPEQPLQSGSSQSTNPGQATPSIPPPQQLLPPGSNLQEDEQHPERSPKYAQFLAEERANTLQPAVVAEAWAGVDVMMDDVATKYAPDVITITLRNDCSKAIRVALTLKVPGDEKWGTIGWRIVGGGQALNTHLVTKNARMYAYAETLDGDMTWSGNDESDPDVETVSSDPLFIEEEGKTPSGNDQRQVKMFTNSTIAWGDHPISFTCKE